MDQGSESVTDTKIADFALLSDCHTSALADPSGSIVWWCPERFDAPAVFASLLDPEGGHWSIRPSVPFQASRRYLKGSLVLETRYETDGGVAVVTDALALDDVEEPHEQGRRSRPLLVRHVECCNGEVPFDLRLAPRFEYGLTAVNPRLSDGQAEMVAGPTRLTLRASTSLECDEVDVTSNFALKTGDVAGFSLTASSRFGDQQDEEIPDSSTALTATLSSWRAWSDTHKSYDGFAADDVRHSALVLRGLTYVPTGAVVAAATTSLPEKVGGDLNWDYRFCWLRDMSLTMRALWVAACPDEAEEFFEWVTTAIGDVGRNGVQIMYAVDGTRDLTEHSLTHLSGYRDSSPVRIGNDAWKQQQLDVMGEVLDAAHLLRDQIEFTDPIKRTLIDLAQYAADNWERPDAGMWEARDQQRHYLSSKVMCWVALDRAIALSEYLDSQQLVESWTKSRDAIRQKVEKEGWSEAANAYTGAFGSDQLDASVLLMPLIDFLPMSDPRMTATVAAIEDQLSDGTMVKRWDDDTAGFFICSFWMVQCLAMAGEVEKAEAWFGRIVERIGDLGFISEEWDSTTSAMIGNYPQTFSHVGLINAAWRIDEARKSDSA